MNPSDITATSYTMMAKHIALFTLFALVSGCGTLLHSPEVAIRAPPEEITALPAGAQVGVVKRLSLESRQIICGTVLQSGPEGIVLMNCNCLTQCTAKTPVLSEIPYVKRYFKMIGVGKELVPILWIPSADIESTVIMEPAPENYIPPQVNIDLSHGFVAERIGIDYDL